MCNIVRKNLKVKTADSHVIVIYPDSFLLVWFSDKMDNDNDLDHIDNNNESGEIFFSLNNCKRCDACW